MNPRCANSYRCLCRCECSQLEPLCKHGYTHKYTKFILQILLCMTSCCVNSHMSVPLRVLTVRTSLHTYMCHKYTYIPSQIRLYIDPCCAISHLYVPLRVLTLRKYTYIVSWLVLYMNPCRANSHMFVPLRVLIVRTSLYTCKYSEVYIQHFTNTFICEPMLEPLCIHRHTHKYTKFILQILLCMTSCCANSHMSVPLRVLTVRTSLHTYICHKYTYIPSQIRWYINPCYAISRLYVPLWVLTLRTSL